MTAPPNRTRLAAAIFLALAVQALAFAAAERDAALFEAARRGDTAAVRTLLRQGAGVNARNDESFTPLMVAAVAGHADTVRALLAARADLKATDEKGLTALHHAAFWGRTRVVEALALARAEVNARTPSGATPLMLAAHEGHVATLMALARAGAALNARARSGSTALMAAASAGRTDGVTALLSAGADANLADENGRTALYYAAAKGHIETVQALLRGGADVNRADKFGNTPLTIAATTASEEGHAGTVAALLAAGADVNARDEKGGTPLLLAARDGHLGVVRALIAAGANPDARDENGRTPLMFSGYNGNAEVVQALLAAAADPNLRDNKGGTALMHAAAPGHADVVRLLVRAGAELDARSSTGATALIDAAYWGRADVVRVLLEAGANVTLADKDGGTALEIARAQNRAEVASLLERAAQPAAPPAPAVKAEPGVADISRLTPPAPSRPAAVLAPPNPQSAAATDVQFTDISRSAGLDFVHINGATPEKFMPETMGSGALFFDFDNDGWLDIFLIDGGSFADPALMRRARHRLYRNNGDGTFADVSARSGIAHNAYGQGACAADYDNDGWLDLYLANVGPNVLYRNNGDGTFTDVTARAGVGNALWGSSCAFGDIDNDGRLDLYVANYVDFTPDNNKFCGDPVQRVRAYCHPHVYNGVPDALYHNNGDGTFTDITRDAGVFTTAGKGLGVVFGDYNDDGWLDIYVANDSVPNFLFRNLGRGKFEEVGFLAGVAVNADGRPEAGMGTDFGDADGDGRLDIFVTNLDLETNTLYRNLGQGLFTDATAESGHAGPSLPFVGFGTAFFDYDNDTDLDVIVANGHILDNAAFFRQSATYAQPMLLFRNQGDGVFREIAAASGAALIAPRVARGLAVGDVDNDGDLDVLVSVNGGPAVLLRNDGGNRRNALIVRTIGAKSNRDAVGARLTLTVAGRSQLREVKAGSSYQGQNDLRVHFGLGDAARAERLAIRWPGGAVEIIEDLPANEIITVTEGKGVTARRPLRRPPPD